MPGRIGEEREAIAWQLREGRGPLASEGAELSDLHRAHQVAEKRSERNHPRLAVDPAIGERPHQHFAAAHRELGVVAAGESIEDYQYPGAYLTAIANQTDETTARAWLADAVVLDTTHCRADEAIEDIVHLVRRAIAAGG